MEIWLALLLFGVGTLLTVKGGDWFVDAAGWMSDVTGIPKVVIGATVVSFATTAPEYFVSLIAILKGSNDLSVGNAVGSLIANLGIAFALLAAFIPDKIHDRLFGAKGGMMIAATAALWIFCRNGAISAWEGAALLLFFLVSVLIDIKYARQGKNRHERKTTTPREIALNIGKFLVGAAIIVWGSSLIVDSACQIALFLGVSETLVGLTIVAVGTSLPEIVTSIAAVVKKQNALSIGNIIGANIIDATLILATGAFVSGGRLVVSPATAKVDLPVALVLMLLAVVPTAIGRKIYRWQGILLIGGYLAYLGLITLAG